ncbi:MAG TPA: lysine--tRNA ligase [Spirochaetia bacterium]|nr:lysine--tRNA ligase [Spirochaetia bacterium]
MEDKSLHWADIYADKIIREKGEKECYTCASGITPSGTVHIGNFREIISVDLVVRALRERGKNVRFIYSWDDYDVFRKVPKNMPKQEELASYLRKPITLVPDPYGKEESYARHHEKEIEEILPRVGIFPEYLYQAQRYRSSLYAEEMRTALVKRNEIRSILDEFRTEPLEEDWWPISVFCTKCDRDTTVVEGWDGDYGITYSCESCGNHETIDLKHTAAAKLPWRIDWPMRWAREKVDFEPAGKDHHSEGGSFDTARKVVQIFGWEAPVSFQYDFISIKGRGGKISSSSGDVISLADVLEVYQPEVARFLFAGTRPNTEFAISFDLDVLKIYEDYDRCERVYFGAEAINEKKREKERRIYELSQVERVPDKMPPQIPFRHLCNLLQVNSGDIQKVVRSFPELSKDQAQRLEVRCTCAWNWITKFSPEDFRFSLRTASDPVPVFETSVNASSIRAVVAAVRAVVDKLETYDERTLAEALYNAAASVGVEATEMFKIVYSVLIGKDKGPRLASFMLIVGKDRLAEILDRFLETSN